MQVFLSWEFDMNWLLLVTECMQPHKRWRESCALSGLDLLEVLNDVEIVIDLDWCLLLLFLLWIRILIEPSTRLLKLVYLGRCRLF